MGAKKYVDDPDQERVCPSCGLVYSLRGIIPHRRNCDLEEPILDPDRDARR